MDIVERLREHNEPPFDYIAHEAAEEIERLRDALSEAIEFADQDYHALTPTGETMISRWRSALQQKDTEKLSQMMIRCGLATGHGDTIDDLIFELEKQIRNTSNAFSDARKQIDRLCNNQSILITSFRVNMMRLCPEYSHEEFDKDIAAMLKEKE